MGTKPSDFDIFECYIEEGRRKFIAASLLTFGYRLFKTATIIKRLEELRGYYDDKSKNLADFPFRFSDILFDSLMDNIRISICFENYFKAKLLLNGFVIHSIDKNKNPDLFKKQKQTPVDVSEIIGEISINKLQRFKSAVNETTINYSTMIGRNEYVKYFNVQPNEIEFLSNLNQKRNRLHLLTSELTSLSMKIINDYEELNTIVNSDIALLQNTLLNELDPESKSKIPFKLSTLH